MLLRVVGILGVACAAACSVDYLDADTDRPRADAGTGGASGSGGVGGVGGGAGASGNCSIVADDLTGDALPTSDWYLGAFEGDFWIALRFTPAVDEVACGVGVVLNATGTGAPGVLRASIYTQKLSAGVLVPDAPIGPASVDVNADTVPTAAGLVTFSGLSANLVKATPYYVVLEKTEVDETNYVVVHHGDATLTEGQSQSSEDGVVWGLVGYQQGLLQIFR